MDIYLDMRLWGAINYKINKRSLIDINICIIRNKYLETYKKETSYSSQVTSYIFKIQVYLLTKRESY